MRLPILALIALALVSMVAGCRPAGHEPLPDSGTAPAEADAAIDTVYVPRFWLPDASTAKPVCGNGMLEGYEECDDGNTVDGDGCTRHCAREVCGNGVLDPGEECDDGNTNLGDGCSPTCRVETCGNGVLEADEACDDGNRIGGDGCAADCAAVQAGWRCRRPGQPCSPTCGNAVRDGSETCDDGNTLDGDGCSHDCLSEPGWDCSGPTCLAVVAGGAIDGGAAQPHCGDGILSGAEECDRGSQNADGVYGGCTTRCLWGPFCGDGVLQAAETCDLGPDDVTSYGPSGCSPNCSEPGYCGDGQVDSDHGEACDLGSLNGVKLDTDLRPSQGGLVYCTDECIIPLCCVY